MIQAGFGKLSTADLLQLVHNKLQQFVEIRISVSMKWKFTLDFMIVIIYNHDYVLLYRYECFTRKQTTRKNDTKLHSGTQWRIFCILTTEDIDDIISRLSHDSFSKLLLEMASGRFVKITEEDIKSFNNDQENVNIKKKTSYNVKTFNDIHNC